MPSKIYRKSNSKGFTRREFMKSVPSSFLSFKVGGLDEARAKSFIAVSFVDRFKQVARRCLESLRVIVNRHIQQYYNLKSKDYLLNLWTYPFQVARKNKAPTGAGADRISSGMRGAFGKTECDLVRIRKKNHKLLSVKLPLDLKREFKMVKHLNKKLNSSCYAKLAVRIHPISKFQDWLSKVI